jgi:hypothetical protein
MKTLIVLLLISSCGTYRKDYHNPVIKRQIVETIQIGVKCPENTFYSFKTGLCHFEPKMARVVAAKPLKRKIKPVLQAKIDCKQVFKRTNQCMGGK